MEHTKLITSPANNFFNDREERRVSFKLQNFIISSFISSSAQDYTKYLVNERFVYVDDIVTSASFF